MLGVFFVDVDTSTSTSVPSFTAFFLFLLTFVVVQGCINQPSFLLMEVSHNQRFTRATSETTHKWLSLKGR
jgi:hypothetical protein